MSQTERTRAVRIRAKATGQSYQVALESPYVEPTSAQRELESLFLRTLGTLWYEPAPEQESSSGIVSVEPRHSSLTVHLGRDTRLGDVGELILPKFVDESTPEPPSDVEIYGIPGLRMSAHPAGTRLYRPGISAELILARVRPSDLDIAPRDHTFYLGDIHPDSWSRQELDFEKRYPLSLGLDIESEMLRRLGIFRAAGAWSAHTWRTAWPSSHAIEIAFEQKVTKEQAEFLRTELMSKHLTPQLTLDRFEAPRGDSGRAYFELSMPDSGHSVEVRLEHHPRPSRDSWSFAKRT
ncbi:hypothetical protein [Microterricola viridarii]|uniref:Uncharacterized protein n=1 Tax=Microterricola viridarii TaxID=412690 RepID=A0A1H1T6L4_9MICO|nr:hypothetical protein [Microterricola viridarii]SDS55279.1 hypothetical protein SAMN04489834_1690 [Microterricola viridarii]